MSVKERSTQALKIAADIMTKKPVVFHSSMTIEEAAQNFLEHNYSSAPVLSSTGEILGVLDEFSLIKIKLIQHLEEQGRDKLAFHVDSLQQATFVKDTAPLLEVVRDMMKAPNHRLLVVNNAHTLMGIISPKDVLLYVVGERRKSQDLKAELEKTKNDLEKTLKELETTKSKLDIYQDMVMDNPTMIHSVNEQGKIIMANKKMHQILGYEQGELVGKSIFDLYAKAVHPDAVSGLKKIMEDGHHSNTFTTMIKKSGEKVRADIASTALFDDHHKFIGTISVSRPVDSDVLLRALHGVLAKEKDGGDRYGVIKELEEEHIEKPKVSKPAKEVKPAVPAATPDASSTTKIASGAPGAVSTAASAIGADDKKKVLKKPVATTTKISKI